MLNPKCKEDFSRPGLSAWIAEQRGYSWRGGWRSRSKSIVERHTHTYQKKIPPCSILLYNYTAFRFYFVFSECWHVEGHVQVIASNICHIWTSCPLPPPTSTEVFSDSTSAKVFFSFLNITFSKINNVKWNLSYNTFRVYDAFQLGKHIHIFYHLITITSWKRKGKYYLHYIKEEIKSQEDKLFAKVFPSK